MESALQRTFWIAVVEFNRWRGALKQAGGGARDYCCGFNRSLIQGSLLKQAGGMESALQRTFWIAAADFNRWRGALNQAGGGARDYCCG